MRERRDQSCQIPQNHMILDTHTHTSYKLEAQHSVESSPNRNRTFSTRDLVCGGDVK